MRPNRLSLFFLFWTPALLPAAAPTANPYAKLPLAFERQGEGPQERYVVRGNGYMIALRGGGATIGVQSQAGSSSSVSMDFAGSRKVPGTAGPELPGKVNYLHGNDPKQWRLGLSTYDSVSYREIYPAIDVVYRGNQRQMEFDLVLRPGADPKRIRLKFDGARELTLDAEGALVVRSTAGDLRIPLPVIYQEVGGAREAIQGRYGLLPNHEVDFRLDAYDRSKPLIIDPTIVYAGLIGGGINTTYSQAIALDSSSNAYITGYTYASDFPTVSAAFSQSHSMPDAFVSKIDPTGTTLLYSTFIGGAGYDDLFSIAVDATGAAWVTGYTSSVDFPVLNAYQSTLNTTSGSYDAVVLKLSAAGGLLYSTYLGSNSIGRGIAIDPAANAYATGFVTGSFPTTAGAYLSSSAGGSDGFVTKFNSSGVVVYSTYLGGTGTDQAYAIAVDGAGNAFITGNSLSTGFASAPTGGAQVSNAGNGDAFVAKLNVAGSALAYFTFLGGSQSDFGYAIAVDSSENAYVGGYTSSTNFPATLGALQTVSGGGTDGFVAKLNSAGSTFTYVTYLGANRQDYVQGLAIDGTGNAYVTGYTDSAQFPTVTPIEGSLTGNSVSLNRTTNSGTSWTPFDTHLPGAATSIAPGTPGVMVAETESGIFRSADSGLSWALSSNLTGGFLSRSLANPSTIYAVFCCYQAYRSTDDGVTWILQGSLNTANRIVADPGNALTAYAYSALNSVALQKTTDGGVTWNPATSGLPSSTPNIYSMVAASDGSLYVDIAGNGVYKSTNQGTTWFAANAGLGSFSGVLNGLAVSASNPAVLYKSVSGSVFNTTVFKTTNGGTSWAVVAGSAPVALGALAVSATNPLLIYAVALSAFPPLYVSTDGGATWNPAGTDLGVASLSQIIADPTNGSAAYALAPVTQAAFAAKINPAGSALVYSTFLGSSGQMIGYGIAANSAGDAFVTGSSTGTFPVTSTTFQANQNIPEGFVVRISAATAACSFSVSPATQLVYGSPGVATYSVVAPSGCAWTATSDQPWATIASGASGSGSGLVSVGVTANNTGVTRTATLTIAGHTASLTQASSSCSYTLGTPTVSAPAGGGPVQTTVLTATGCPWSVINNYPFALSVASGASGTGNGTVMLTVAAAASQTAVTFSVSIGGAIFTITQAGYPTAVTYLVGDVAPFTGDSAPNFGDGNLNILDLVQILFAVNNVPGFRPAPCSDRFDAMDLFPVDTGTTRGGDGVLDIRDLIRELFRVNNLDLDRPVRTSRGGVCPGIANTAGGSPTAAMRSGDFSPRSSAGVQGALVLGNPERSGAAQERVPVYLEAGRDLVRVAVTFALGDQRSQLRFVTTPDTPPSLAQDSQLGVVAVAWLEGVTVRAGERLLLGYVEGPAGASASLKVFGISASGLGDNQELRLGTLTAAGLGR